MFAAQNNHTEAAAVLVRNGANLSLASLDGANAAEHARQQNFHAMQEWLRDLLEKQLSEEHAVCAQGQALGGA